MEKFLELDEVTLLPAKKSSVGMTEMNFLDNDMLPILTAPLPEICGEFSTELWMENSIRPVIPKDEPLDYRLKMCPWSFATFSPQEVENEFLRKDRRGQGTCLRIYIDSISGQDPSLFQLAFSLKSAYKDGVCLMGGPCGNPEAYNFYSQAGFQYMVLGTGIGEQYGFHYPLAQLLVDLTKFKAGGAIGFKPVKIVAEGDFMNPSDIVKVMALGADCVMVRKAFANIVEAEGTIYSMTKDNNGKDVPTEVDDQDALSRITPEQLKKAKLIRPYQGKWIPVNIKMRDWIRKFQEAASFAFMMTGTKNWTEFKKEIKYGRVRVD